MKIATFNINGINGRLKVLLRWLKEAKPDIVCLKELKAPQHKFPVLELQAAGYSAIWHGQERWNGVAILSKIGELQEVRRLLPGDRKDDHSRYIEAIVNKVLICCLYLPNGNPTPGPKFDYKLKWLKRLNKHAKMLLQYDVPIVLCGDFNVIPAAQDVYRPERWVNDALFKSEVRKEFDKLLSSGWTDALRSLYPEKQLFTFWDYLWKAYERDAGMRLDHFLLNPHISERLVSAGIDKKVRGWEKASDHAPVWIKLK